MNQKRIIKIVSTQPSSVLDIRFWPTDICNYDCSYCFPNSKDAVYRYPKNIETVIKNFRILFDFYKEKFEKDEFRINLVGGGEPTLWPYFGQFCKEIKQSHNVKIQVTTNGSRSLRWWEENYHYIDKAVLSYHHEHANLSHYIDVADFLYQNEIIINSLVLMDPTHWEKCINSIEVMKKSKYPWIIEAKAIVDSPGRDIESYNEEQIKFVSNAIKRLPDSNWILKRLDLINPFKSIALYDDGSATVCKPEDHISNKSNFFFNWTCNVSIENLVITYDGSVTGSCQEKIFENSNINLFSEDFEKNFNSLPIKLDPISCPRLQCSCQPDTHITKYRS